MLKVVLLIDNKTAQSCSPLKFLEKFILHEAKPEDVGYGSKICQGFNTQYAHITVTEIEQI